MPTFEVRKRRNLFESGLLEKVRIRAIKQIWGVTEAVTTEALISNCMVEGKGEVPL